MSTKSVLGGIDWKMDYRCKMCNIPVTRTGYYLGPTEYKGYKFCAWCAKKGGAAFANVAWVLNKVVEEDECINNGHDDCECAICYAHDVLSHYDLRVEFPT